MTASRLTTIFSTGDAGAARGALDAAAELELKIGGHTAADPPAPYAEHLRRTLAPRMAARLNVQDSDGTLIVSFSTSLPAGSGAAYADEAADHQRKPSLHIVLPRGSHPEDVRRAVLEWCETVKIATLHVTGPREAEEPGIQQAVHDALVWIFEDEVETGAPEAATPAVSTPPTSSRVPQSAPPGPGATLPQPARPFAGVDRAAVPEPLRSYDELERAAELAALPSPTHIAINPANVDAAIAAGLDVEWVAPPSASIDAEFLAAQDIEWRPPPVPPVAERAPHPGELDACSCPSHVDQDGNITRRPTDGA